MARPKGKINLIKTESIQSQVIAAQSKVGSLLEQITKVPEMFEAIKKEVEATKSDMDLGLKQYENEIQEKKAAIDDVLEARKFEVDTLQKKFDEDYESSKKHYLRQLEDLKYNHNKSIEQEDLNTATVIASKKGMILVDKDLENNYKSQLDTLQKENDKKLAIACNSVKKDVEDKNAAQIMELQTANKLLQNDLNAKSKEVASLESQIEYLKEQVDAARQATVEALAAAKVSVTQSNTGK